MMSKDSDILVIKIWVTEPYKPPQLTREINEDWGDKDLGWLIEVK